MTPVALEPATPWSRLKHSTTELPYQGWSLIHKMLVRIANRKDPDQTASQKQSDLGLHCFLMPFGHATCVRNYRISIVQVNFDLRRT